ncbi:MAG: hypothetical protein LBC12_01805 [Nitrososphaerota archaeon]|nr:hypothetical protein [Nitrososphaerota archaeon]
MDKLKNTLSFLFQKVKQQAKIELRYHFISNMRWLCGTIMFILLVKLAFLFLQYELVFPPHFLSFSVILLFGLFVMHWSLNLSSSWREYEEEKKQKKLAAVNNIAPIVEG